MIARSLGTHDGSFHADEVSACALLLVFDLIDREGIIRTRDPEKLAQCEYVCDVGGEYDPSQKRFDHHQLTYEGYLASAGMIWEYLLDQGIIDERLYDSINRSLIIGVDAHDNGKVVQKEGVTTFSHVIANFVPIDYDASEEELNRSFFDALDFAIGHIERLLERYRFARSCRKAVEEAMKPEEKALIFDHAVPWQDSFFELGGINHPALFVVMPSGDHWKLRGIPPNPQNRMQVRLPLPEAWAGYRGYEFEQISGIPGGIFCHKGRFISIWETKEAALEALNVVLNEEGKK